MSRSCILLALAVLSTPLVAADFTSLRGPTGSGGMVEWSGGVRDPKAGKQLWMSEEPGLGAAWAERSGGGNKNRGVVRGSGYSGVVAAGGRVYLTYWKPAGDVVDEETRAKGKDQRPESWKVEADDICVCRDAETGKVLWRAVFERKGLNWNYGRKSPWTHVVVEGDHVFFMGCAGKVYCMNAKDGSTVWESDTGAGFQEFESLRKQLLAAKTTMVRNMRTRIGWNNNTSATMSTPCLIDGVVICNDSLPDKGRDNGHGLVGLDAASGKQLWRLPAAIGCYTSPVPWTHDGTSYCIAVSPGHLRCVEPETGRVVWSVAGSFSDQTTPAVDGDWLVMQGYYLRGKWKEQTRKGLKPDSRGLCAYRLAPSGAELAFALDVEQYAGPWVAPLIHDGHAYARCLDGLVCIELASGKEVARVDGRFDVYQPLQAGNGLLIAKTAVFKLDPKDFVSLGGIKVWSEPFTQGHFHEGRFYTRGRAKDPVEQAKQGQEPERGAVYCIDLRK